MGEFSITHMLLLLVIVLIFFGPGRLPGLGKSMGEAIRGFKKGLDGSGDQNTQAPPPQPQQVTRQVNPIELPRTNEETHESDPTRTGKKEHS